MMYMLVFAAVLWTAVSMAATVAGFVLLSAASDFGVGGAVATVAGSLALLGAGFVSCAESLAWMTHVAAG